MAALFFAFYLFLPKLSLYSYVDRGARMRIFLSWLMILSFTTVFAAAKKLPESAFEIQLSFSKTVKKVAPAVVNVYSSKIIEARQSVFANDPFFQQFFGRNFGGQFGRTQPRVQKSLGSGVIVDKTGIVVTNHHVIKGGTKIRVVLADLREFDAEIILEDEKSDLAILRLVTEAEDFIYVEFADSDDVEVGDLALAIGNPFGVGQTVTSGIVSAVARTNVGISDFQFFIQTDAAINPGNSGGALVDSLGRLIGVNTAIYSRSGGSNGIGFAIPANMVRLVVNSSKIGSRVFRPWMGVELQSFNAEINESLGLTKAVGVLITSLDPVSPIRKAGMRRSDVIRSIDGIDITNKEHFLYLISSKLIGETTSFYVLRRGQQLEFDVELIAAPEEPPRRTILVEGEGLFTGAEIMNISPAVIEEMSLPLGSVGVIISHININSIAFRYGLKVGDIIKNVSDVDIGEVADLIAENDKPKRVWRLTINRGGRIIRSTIHG